MDAVILDPKKDAASKLDKLKGVAAELHEIGAQIQVGNGLIRSLAVSSSTCLHFLSRFSSFTSYCCAFSPSPPLQQCEALYKELIAGDDSSASDLESSDMKSGLDELQQLYADKAKDLEARTEELQSGAQVSGC